MAKLIGSSPNQVSLNGMLGNLAFQSAESVSLGSLTVNTLNNNPILNAGTANSVLYLDGSKVATTGSLFTYANERLRVDRTSSGDVLYGTAFNANVGIFLERTGSSPGSFRINQTDSQETYFDASSASHKVIWRFNSVEQMRLNSTGLGIGNSAPNTKLDITTTANNGIRLFQTGASNAWNIYTSGNNLRFIEENVGSVMAINAGGNVGIGTTSPNARLQVTSGTAGRATYSSDADDIVVDSTGSGSGITIASDRASYGVIYFADQDSGTRGIFRYDHLDNSLRFGVGGSEVMRLDSSGNLGIGTSSPTAKLHVEGNTNSNSVIFFKNSNPATTAFVSLNLGNDANGLGGFKYTSSTFTGTPNALLYGGDYHVFNTIAGVERMRLDSSGFLGIGTAAPTCNLSMEQYATSGDAAPFTITIRKSGADRLAIGYANSPVNNSGFAQVLADSSAGNLLLVSRSNVASSIIFYTNSATTATERMRIDYSGNLGLGVTPSAWSTGVALQTRGAGLWDNGVNNTYLVQNAFFNGTNWIYRNSFAASQYLQIGGVHQWWTAPAGTAGNTAVFTQAMTLDASGNLGIGTTSPVGRLRLAGSNATAFPNQGGCLWLTDTNAVANEGNWAICSMSGSFRIFTGNFAFSGGYSAYRIDNSGTTNEAANHIWYTGVSQERMRLDYSGNLGIGTSSPVYKLQVAGTSGTVGIGITGTVAANTIGLFINPSAITGEYSPINSTPSATDNVTYLFANTNSSSVNANSRVDVRVTGAGGGDPKTTYTINGVLNWSVGVDNSDSDKFKISCSDSPGTSDYLTIDTSGNLGIGTSSPQTRLHVVAASAADVEVARFQNPYTGTGSASITIGDTGGSTYRPFTIRSNWTSGPGVSFIANRDLAGRGFDFRNNADTTSLFFIESTGNIGLGVTPGAWQTNFRALQMFGAGISLMSGTSNGYILNNALYDGAFKYINSTAATNYATSGGQHVWYNAPSGTAGNTISFTQAMTLDANGRLQIGGTTAYDSAMLSVTTPSQTFSFVVDGGTTGNKSRGGFIHPSANVLALNVDGASGILAFTQNGVERMRLDASGNLGLGVTPSAWATTGNLQLQSARGIAFNGNAYFYANAFSGSGGNTYITTSTAAQYAMEAGAHRWFTAPSGTAGTAISFTQVMMIDASGNLGIGTTSPVFRLDVSNPNALPARFTRNAAGSNLGGLVLNQPNTTDGNSLVLRYSTDTTGAGATTDVSFCQIEFAADIHNQATRAGSIRFTTSLGSVGDNQERLRITSTGNQIATQPAESAQNANATLTVANLQTRIITSNAAVTLTLPTGTDLDTYTTSMATNTAFECTFIATTANAITIAANGNTTVGSLTVAGNTSGTFRFRKTAANTFTVYRVA